MNPPRVVIRDDHGLDGTCIRLENAEYYIEQYITAECALDAVSAHAIILETLERLARAWQKRFGGPQLAITEAGENTRWSTHYTDDNVIDGEVVTKAIEGGTTDATRGCIEGR